MNKRAVIFGFLFLILLSSVLAQVGTSGLEAGVGEVQEKTEGIKQLTEKERWEFLGEKWKGIFLENEFIGAVDKTFRQFNFLFLFLFGEDYDLSLILLFAILLWAFFFLAFGRILTDFSTFGEGVSYSISFILVIIMAQLRVYEGLSILLFKLIFFREGIWGWVWFFIILFGFIFLGIYIRRVIWLVGRWFKKSKEEKEKWDEKFQRELFRKKVKSVEKAFSTVEKEFNS